MLDTGSVDTLTFVCKKCGVAKLASEFHVLKRNRSGRSGTCRDCSQEYQRVWRANHVDSIRQSRLGWAERNPDAVAFNRIDQAEKGRTRTKANRGDGWPKETEEGRWCPICETRKPREAFGSLATVSSGLQNSCRECVNGSAIADRKNTEPKKLYHRGRKSVLKTRYGLTIAEYEAMIEAQGNGCAICQEPIKDWKTGDGLNARGACVDHDHESGAVRGILCVKCNSGLGQFRDDVSLLACAIVYLDRARATAITAMSAEILGGDS